jgi:starch synthase
LTPGEEVRVLGLVEGDPTTALSGVGHFVLDALGRQLSVVDTIDYSAHGLQRLALAAGTFRPDRPSWRARFHTSRLAHRVLSRNLSRRRAKLDRQFDVAVQIHGWVAGQPRPYALFVDQTRLMAERGWPEWMPLTRRERDELIALETAMYAEAFHVFTMGAPGRDSLLSDYGVDPARITIAGGGLRFGALPPPAQLNPEPRILFVGRDFERKGGDILIRAFELVRRELPDATLDLVGVGERFDVPGVTSHGKIATARQMQELYAGARVFTLPSRYEPYGLVLIEAMAHGVPCIGADVQSIPEILDSGRTGLLVEPGDPDGLAEALVKLLGDYKLALSVGAAGRERVASHLTWDHVAGRMAPILSRATRRG